MPKFLTKSLICKILDQILDQIPYMQWLDMPTYMQNLLQLQKGTPY